MAEINDGGPAFPVLEKVQEYRDDRYVDVYMPTEGMKLRDYFAAKALIAMTANDHVDGNGDPERHAAAAYRYADAMIAAREAKR